MEQGAYCGNEVQILDEELKKAKKMNKNKDKGSSKRKASAVENDNDEPASDNEGDGEAESNEQQAGNEFGRGGREKKKVTISSTATQAALPKQAQRHVMVTRTQRFVMDNAQLASQGNDGRVELDTHVDTCIAGSNAVVIDFTGKHVAVSPICKTAFDAIQDIPIATVATAYHCPTTGKTYILVINEAFFGDKMAHTLLCPNQLQHNGLKVDDCTKAV